MYFREMIIEYTCMLYQSTYEQLKVYEDKLFNEGILKPNPIKYGYLINNKYFNNVKIDFDLDICLSVIQNFYEREYLYGL